ncbi:MAG TPA: RNA polymerase factor sigma-54 [Candidatus Kapabacteria bacterium]|nr:RNA polymerase factor sigma-54 [Candidatus Kapabacteria bacterium]
MKIGLDIRTALTQTLTPQQIQYLKLLQMSVVEFEQYLDQEIEQNPLIENPDNPDNTILEIAKEISGDDEEFYNETTYINDISDSNSDLNAIDNFSEDIYSNSDSDDYNELRSQIDDDGDPFEFHDLVWQDESSDTVDAYNSNESDDEDFAPFQIKDNTSFAEDLETQFNLQPLSEDERSIGKIIIGNIDDDGYIRMTLEEVRDFVNSQIAEYNFNIQQKEFLKKNEEQKQSYNPASQFALSNKTKQILEFADELKESDNISDLIKNQNNHNRTISYASELKIPVTLEQVEKVHGLIKLLDPPGVGSRNMQECLIAQIESLHEIHSTQVIALDILKNSFEPFTKKHFDVLMNKHNLTTDGLREVMDYIKKLNPKPGRGNSVSEMNTVIPDFIVEVDKEDNELLISLNDNKMPVLKVSKAYEILKKSGKIKNFNKETKEWLRQKNEDAKFIIQAVQQRKITMMKVMTAISQLQKDFFIEGKAAIKPLIYKNIADDTNIDISTVCRIVNNKYVLTQFGTFELKFFFSESLPSVDGEDISTTVIKDSLKDLIDSEPKNAPHSDELLANLLKDMGFNVARRTVAKYREQLKIPVARLRKEL